jgi:hypothetical protein
LSHSARVLDVENPISNAVQNERRSADRGQDVSYIDFSVHLHDRGGSSGACRCAKIGSEAFGGIRIAGKARRPHLDTNSFWCAPIAFDVFEEPLPLLVVPA